MMNLQNAKGGVLHFLSKIVANLKACAYSMV